MTLFEFIDQLQALVKEHDLSEDTDIGVGNTSGIEYDSLEGVVIFPGTGGAAVALVLDDFLKDLRDAQYEAGYEEGFAEGSME